MKKITDYKPRKNGETPIAFFHYWEDGEICYQGYITRLEKDYSGTCLLFDWLLGEEGEPISVNRAFFDDCTFYDSDYQMRSAYARSKT
jgi:hypothetical protein